MRFPKIPSDLREQVRHRYVFRCGYCGVTERQAGSGLTIDHFQPQSLGGTDDLDNLVYSCFACNTYKSDCWAPDSVERILHPLDDDLTKHYFEDSAGVLHSLTITGEFHIEQLHLNRPPLVDHRSEEKLIASLGAEERVSKQEFAEIRQEIIESRESIIAASKKKKRRKRNRKK